MVDGNKYISLWGLTPAVDLLEEFENRMRKNDEKYSVSGIDELQILIVGGSDFRHILKTIASPKRQPYQRLHFHIAENCLELYARQLLFLGIALESSSVLSIQDKTFMFLEIFGNTLIRSHTYEYIKNKSNEILRIIGDIIYRHECMPCINLDQMLFRELDCLENILKVWREPNPKSVDIRKFWNFRLREQYGQRYDSRQNLFDYDFSMRLIDANASMIGYHKYCNWRGFGVAFDQRYGSYLYPNKTICSGLPNHHLRYKLTIPYPTGFWGDIVSSPYLAFGIECENPDLLKMENNKYVNNGEDISTYNTRLIMEKIDLLNDHETPISSWLQFDFISYSALQKYHRKCEKKLDVIYVSPATINILNRNLATLFTENALLIIETCKFVLNYRAKEQAKFKSTVETLANEIDFHVLKDYDPMKDAYARFIRKTD